MKGFISIILLFLGVYSFGQTVHTTKSRISQNSRYSILVEVLSTSIIQVFSHPATSALSIQPAIENANFRLLNLREIGVLEEQALKHFAFVDLTNFLE
ncbi:hypothetical protein [Reichenbachiella sp.]|uniref:hypothetical protein n=1 Tax=Reichenbachiella sp. TaxID=2184521 RepID=UPI003B5A6E23